MYHRRVSSPRHRLSKISILAFALLAGAAHAAPTPAITIPPPPPPAPVGAIAPIDRILAIVDGTPIWWSAFAEAVAVQPPPADEPARKQLEAAALDHLMADILISHRARAMHLDVSEVEVDQGVQTILQQNKLDMAGLQSALSGMGLTMAAYRESLRQQILDIKAFQIWVAGQPPFDKTPENLATAHDRWVNELGKVARIERR